MESLYRQKNAADGQPPWTEATAGATLSMDEGGATHRRRAPSHRCHATRTLPDAGSNLIR